MLTIINLLLKLKKGKLEYKEFMEKKQKENEERKQHEDKIKEEKKEEATSGKMRRT